MLFSRGPAKLLDPTDTLPGRDEPIVPPDQHAVTGRPLTPPWPEGHEVLVLGMGCFWGAERLYWSMPGVWTTAVGYAAGVTPNPTYEEVCSGRTNHAEVVLVVFDPATVGVEELLAVFWENHDPTQVMGQGNDVGTQYRSLILPGTEEQRTTALASRDRYQQRLEAAGYGAIATEVLDPERLVDGLPGSWGYAEDYHQQYLHKHPGGYCNHGFCQVAYG
jgi:peptide-methionine (S)-S-oxide reductase